MIILSLPSLTKSAFHLIRTNKKLNNNQLFISGQSERVGSWSRLLPSIHCTDCVACCGTRCTCQEVSGFPQPGGRTRNWPFVWINVSNQFSWNHWEGFWGFSTEQQSPVLQPLYFWDCRQVLRLALRAIKGHFLSYQLRRLLLSGCFESSCSEPSVLTGFILSLHSLTF